MSKHNPLIDEKGEVRELSVADLKRFKPAREVLPKTLLLKLQGRGLQKAATKERITIRLSPEVVQPFRDTGDGWQTRVDAALKDWLTSHRPSQIKSL